MDYRGARFYDADVGRFLSLDPLAVEYPNWSDYNYVLGNPIIFIDPDGRNTTYYDSDGNFLWYSYDDEDDAVTFIPKNKIKEFNDIIDQAGKKCGDDCNNSVKALRALGDSYMLEAIIAFDAKYGNNKDATIYRGLKIVSEIVFTPEGSTKSITISKVFAEYAMNLNVNDAGNVITLAQGAGKTDNDMVYVNIGKTDNAVGFLHVEPPVGEYNFGMFHKGLKSS